jgi:hypothetical protein
LEEWLWSISDQSMKLSIQLNKRTNQDRLPVQKRQSIIYRLIVKQKQEAVTPVGLKNDDLVFSVTDCLSATRSIVNRPGYLTRLMIWNILLHSQEYIAIIVEIIRNHPLLVENYANLHL